MVYSDCEKLNGRPDLGLFLFLDFLVQERCRRRFFFVKKHVFGPGVLPQAPFFSEKTRFWSWNVAAGAFFGCPAAASADHASHHDWLWLWL